MHPHQRLVTALVCAASAVLFSPVLLADTQPSYTNPNVNLSAQSQAADANSSYGQKIGNKAARAFANIGTSGLEMPKNIINTVNQGNPLYGFFGGMIKGLANMVGRTGCGLIDLITFPLPTKPSVFPLYIWDDFDVDTTYGPILRLNNSSTEPGLDQPR